MNTGASFSAAIAWLKAGYKVRRAAWRHDQYWRLNEQGRLDVYWSPSLPQMKQPGQDLLAEDWQLVRE